MLHKINVFILLALLNFSTQGQTYSHQVSVPSVEESGFYKILLPPAVTSALKPDVSDIRIYDSSNLEVPYLLEKEKPINKKELFVAYEIIAKKHFKTKDGGYTRIVIHNPDKNKINNIVLRVNNADVRKQLKLNASYDNENWYVLKDNYYYNSVESNTKTSEIRVLNFPLSDYEYYELLIDDFFDKPINIFQAGYYNSTEEEGKYSELKSGLFAEADTLKETIVAVPVCNYIDKIAFQISAPEYYKRAVTFFVKQKRTNRKRTEIIERKVGEATLVSNSDNAFSFQNLKADTLFVRIENEDNRALKIDSIRLYQLNKYLIAKLAANQSYHMKFSSDLATKPVYDLKYFSDEIPPNLKVLDVSHIVEIGKPSSETSNNIDFANYWLWVVIIGLAVLLAYMSYSMLNEKKKTPNQE